MTFLLCILPPVAPDTPLLGAASLAGSLARAGHICHIYDANIALYAEFPQQQTAWKSVGWSIWSTFTQYSVLPELVAQRLYSVLREQHVDGLALSCASAGRPFLDAVLEVVRREDAYLPILLGGPAFFHAEDISACSLPPRVSVCRGEGESAIVLWADSLCQGHTQQAVYACPQANLDSLALPDFAPFCQQGYTRSTVLPLESSRGCTNACAFCDDRAMWGGYRAKSPQRITQEAKILATMVRHLTFCDSLLNPNGNALRALAASLAPLALTWDGMMQCVGIDKDIACVLKNSGCVEVFLGVESFDADFRRLLHKSGKAEQAYNAILTLHGAGIAPCIGIIVAGPPLQSRHQFEHDMRCLEILAPHLAFVAINPLCLPQGTALWKKHKSLGIDLPEKNPWRNWYGSGGNKDVLTRQAWCRELRAHLHSLGVRVEDELPI